MLTISTPSLAAVAARTASLAFAAMVALTAPAPATGESLATVTGTVVSAGGAPAAGAVVALNHRPVATADSQGAFRFEAAPGIYRLVVRPGASGDLTRELTVPPEGLHLALELPPPTVSEEITVSAIRASDRAPVTTTDLARDEIEELSYGQDVPALVESTPSATWYSDSGAGSNYSYFSLRGIQQSRINLTFDGAPLNDPAEHALYFNNFHDFLSMVDSVQIQRGVGTSTVGAPAFGGSINFTSRPLAEEPRLDGRLVVGSFDTRRASVGYQTGRLVRSLAFSGRVSYSDTEGYRDNSGSEHLTLFLDGEWRGERSQLKLISFSGEERSQLSFLAVDPETLAANPRANPLAPDERDRFRQRFAQLRYTRSVGSNRELSAAVYFNGADGVFLLRADPAAPALLAFGIDQEFFGGSVTMSTAGQRLGSSVGVHYRDFEGDHTLDFEGVRFYRNTGLKREANGFAKAEYRLGRWLLFGDAHLRWAEFDYRGDVDPGSIDWTFFDPKVGVRYTLSPGASVYLSAGRAQREPTRLDLLAGEDNATVAHDLAAVRPEEVVDFELGLEYSSSRLAFAVTLYAMEFDEEIALTGELSAIGLPLRENVAESYRRGLELELDWRLSERWSLSHASNLSRNRIGRWTQFYDRFDAGGTFLGQRPITHTDVPPLLTPEVVVHQSLTWSERGGRVTLAGRYVGDSHLDNTGNGALRVPSYLRFDLRSSIELERWGAAGSPRLTLHARNLFDAEDQYASGYSYLFLQRDETGREAVAGLPFYYPLAGRQVVLNLEFGLR